jgi:competence protein ComEA
VSSLESMREYATIVLLNLTALGLIVWQLRDPRSTAVRIEPPPTSTPAPSATPFRMHVHVSGAVVSPDVVELGEGARARDAIAAAGGFSGRADRAGVNLAAPLSDGQQLHVPEQGEAPPPVAGVSGSSGVAGDAVGAASGYSNASGGTSAINVNTATAAELEALPGVGPALAGRIVAHREEHGRFGGPEALLAVSGIGEKTLARFADQIVTR